MYLKSLELSGFKSFAKKGLLQFTTPITSIVGPNGSGKSNVAEAFRFVLGEQSIKSLRGKRGEDMIWNGGGEGASSSTRANRAHVKLAFDNTRRIFPNIDFDEVTVERIVHRDNSNEYLLNGTQVRLKDIVELLAGAHIGATGHHIISQGEADRILSASVRERREMIEDALGLKIYQWKKLESIRKLERTEENMKQVESLRREIAPHLRFLKKQVEKVEKAEEMRRELVALYKVYFSVESAYIASETARIAHELAGPEKEQKQLDHELTKAKEILSAAVGKDKKSDEIISLENQLREFRAEKDAATRELGRLEGEIGANKRSIEREKEKAKREEGKMIPLKEVESLAVTVESFRSIEDAKKLFHEIVQALKDFVARHRSSTDSALINDALEEIEKLTHQKTSVETRLAHAVEKEKSATHEYEALKKAIEREKDTNREAEKEVFRIIARQNEVRATISRLITARDALAHEDAAFKQELGEAAKIAGREATQYEEQIQKQRSNDPTDLSNINKEREEQADKRKQIEKLKIRIEDSGAAGGNDVLKEYRETEERDTFLARELEDLAKARVELLTLIEDLDMRIDLEFKNGIMKINSQFGNFFALMFGGGKAELSLVKEVKRRKKSDSEELRSALVGDDEAMDLAVQSEGGNDEEGPEGLEVNVSLPRKKVKGLMMLSGGERALTSIALLFAISQVNPPPFIILDETDAALDEANSKKYGDMIENLSKHSQLILITHNRETMSRAGVLYGVTMGSDGASKLLSIQFDEAVKVAK